MHNSKSDDLRNQRQLHEALILHICEELNRKYKTVEDCFEAIYKSLNNGHGPICRHCGCCEFDKKYGDRAGKCKKCRVETHFTANTIYEDCRNPRPYLAVTYLLGKGITFNASQLARATHIATSTASVIYKKIQFVLTALMKDDKSVAEVNSSFFLEVMSKRSRRTPAQQHPAAEQAAFEDEVNAAAPQSTAHNLSPLVDEPPRELTEVEQTIWDLLGQDCVPFNTLQSKTNIRLGTLSHLLVIMELDGVITREDGDCYSRVKAQFPPHTNPNSAANANNKAKTKHKLTASQTAKSAQIANPSPPPNATFNFRAAFPTDDVVEEIISSIIRIKENFHGISRKYLQPYLAMYWCVDNRRRWSFRALLQACGKHGALPAAKIEEYVTPLTVALKVAV